MEEFALYKGLPKNCYRGKEIPISSFHQLGDIPPKALEYFDLCVIRARLMFSFKEDKINIPKVTDKVIPYEELQILEVEISTRSDGWMRLYSLAKTIFQSIPYPMLLVLRYKHYVKAFTSEFSRGKQNINKNIVDTCHATDWINIEMQTDIDEIFIEQFCECFHYAKDMKDLYSLWSKNVFLHMKFSYEIRWMHATKIHNEYAAELLREKDFGCVPQEWLEEYFPTVPKGYMPGDDDDSNDC